MPRTPTYLKVRKQNEVLQSCYLHHLVIEIKFRAFETCIFNVLELIWPLTHILYFAYSFEVEMSFVVSNTYNWVYNVQKNYLELLKEIYVLLLMKYDAFIQLYLYSSKLFHRDGLPSSWKMSAEAQNNWLCNCMVKFFKSNYISYLYFSILW